MVVRRFSSVLPLFVLIVFKLTPVEGGRLFVKSSKAQRTRSQDFESVGTTTKQFRNTMRDSSVVPPSISSGARRMKLPVLYGMLFLSVVYFGVYFYVNNSVSGFSVGKYSQQRPFTISNPPPPQQMAIPAAEYCPEDNASCFRPDLAAFQCTCGVALWYLGLQGFFTWHVSRRAHTIIPQTPEGRLFGYLKESEWLAAASVAFQVWDFIASLFIEEHSSLIMLAHHIIAGIVSWMSLESQVRCHRRESK
jgi:hypothetical protein